MTKMSENNCTLTQYIVSVVKKKVCYENTKRTLQCNIIFGTYRVHFRQCFRLVNENESFSVSLCHFDTKCQIRSLSSSKI